MDNAQLNETLSRLQDELKSVAEFDDPSREILKKLDGDIHRILQNSGDVPAAHHAGLRESLEDSVEYLEASHPTITALINQLLKALSDMGI
jgi:hypothetical protein